MTKQVQRRRGTSTQHTSFTGAEGEISVNTTNKSVHVHDGVTAGGVEAARADLDNVLASDIAASISGSTVASMTITSADINGGTIDGTVIGGSTAAAGTFTSATVTGNLTVDTNTLLVDSANNQVGVGTISPEAKASIVSAAGAIGLTIKDSNAGANTYLSAQYNGTSGVADIKSQSSSGSTQLAFSTSSSGTTAERMRIDSSGNVGIGTSSPNFKLDVAGNARASYFALRSNETAPAEASFIYRPSTGVMGFGTASAERLRIDSSGNVGIGTSSPSGKLEVGMVSALGSGSFSGGTDFIRLFATSGSAYAEPAIKFQEVGSDVGCVIAGKNRANGAMDIVFANRDTSSTTSTLTERMRIDSSGNVGIGTSPSFTFGSGLEVQRAGSATVRVDNSTDGVSGELSAYNSGMLVYTLSSHPVIFGTSGGERARIDPSGRLLIGMSTASTSNAGFWIGGYASGGSGYARMNVGKTESGNRFFTSFYYNGSTVGSIQYDDSSVSFNTVSDYRLKENVIGITDGIERVKQLKPSRFNFIADAGNTVDGFIAHEVQAIVPESISGEKDAIDEDGNPEYQGIDKSRLVPLLTAALQEAIAKIETLEARVAALEGN